MSAGYSNAILISQAAHLINKYEGNDIHVLGKEDYMMGNGFALGPDSLAYVVDSDAGALVEIDLDSMQILRQVNYRYESKERDWLQKSVSRLVDLAATPARAKRWMSKPEVSPDGRHLVVDGGFGIGSGVTTLVDLENLVLVKEIKLPKSPQAFHFAIKSSSLHTYGNGKARRLPGIGA